MTSDEVKAAIREASGRYGVDPDFALAVAWQESRYNAAARSSAGAIGAMQLMPATALDLGVDPYDPVQNIDGGVRLLGMYIRRYSGDLSKVLWAYNAGPGNLARNVLPAETAHYIPTILGKYRELQGAGGNAPASTVAHGGAPVLGEDAALLAALAVGGVSLLALIL